MTHPCKARSVFRNPGWRLVLAAEALLVFASTLGRVRASSAGTCNYRPRAGQNAYSTRTNGVNAGPRICQPSGACKR